MARSAALGIKRLEDILFVVNDIERSTRFYTEKLDFALTARSSAALEAQRGETTRVFEAGQCKVTVVQPLVPTSISGRYLKRHPDGITTLVFEVADVRETFKVLESRGATLVDEIAWVERGAGRLGFFDITTPFGEGRFRFLERHGWEGPNPGLDAVAAPATHNRFGFEAYDHVTSNFLTLKPMVLWCKEVLGLEEYWDIEFHTDDKAGANDHGSGLKSIVLWDPHSGVKFANNEPKRPHFESSQIYGFVVDNLGEGFQHAAITTADIIGTVRGLRERAVTFMPTPGSYYDLLPQRMLNLGVGVIDEDVEVLRGLEILVDGKGPGSYLLQIFLKEAAGLYGDEKAGPFFFEIIQRKGDRGFGGGNFRALFESIEYEQKQRQTA
ncbi:MAG: VOC family protein [Deltaproteobacteria bacterium]|jgi:4-hydroxyphenylpyruvate dioxygenase|nr:VOC family protein [Deltaproteobacteria bacterium]